MNPKNIKRAVEVREQLREYLIDINNKRNVFVKNKEEFRISEKYNAEGFLKCLAKGTISKKATLGNSGTYVINVSVG